MKRLKAYLTLHVMLALPLFAFSSILLAAICFSFGLRGRFVVLLGIVVLAIVALNALFGLQCPYMRRACYECTALFSLGGGAKLSDIRRECLLSKAHRKVDHKPFVRSFLNTELNIRKSYLGRAIQIIGLMAFILGPMLLLLSGFWEGELKEYADQAPVIREQLEVGAVLGSFFQLWITFFVQQQQKKFLQSKILFSLVFACSLGLGAALALLFEGDPEKRPGHHIWALLLYSVFAACYDLLGSIWGASEDDRKELLGSFFILDFPILLSSFALLVFWYKQQAQRDAAEMDIAESLLAGAVAMQFIISACLFAVIRSGLIRQQPTAAAIPQNRSTPGIARGAAT